jgi:hypothetical protein
VAVPLDDSVQLRACETFTGRITRILRDMEGVTMIDEQTLIIVEPISPEEERLQPGDRSIPVCHTQTEASLVRPYGYPFMFPVFAVCIDCNYCNPNNNWPINECFIIY